ncbi:hypothetical protein CLU79DRAFT_686484, partial [Phycomyces nitens]
LNYFLPRATIRPSAALQSLVFQNIEYWKDRFANDSTMQEDIAGPNFLNLLVHLRVVFLQDSVVLKKKYPTYYLWTCKLFNTAESKHFELQVLGSLEQKETVFLSNRRIQMAMPELVATLQDGFDKITTMMLATKAERRTETQNLQDRMSEFLAIGSALFSSTPTSIASLSNFPLQQPNPDTLQVSCYQMSRKIVSVTDVWR